MGIRDGHHRKVSFNTREELGNKIDKLAVMIGKLATKESRSNRQFKPQIHQSRGRGQNRNCNQRNYQNRYGQNNRSNSRDRGQYRQDRNRPRHEPRYEQNYRRGNFRGNVRNYNIQDSRGKYRNNCKDDSYDRSWNRSRERWFPEIMAIIELEAQAIVDPGQDPELIQIGIEFVVISVGNIITSQETVPLPEKK